MQEISQTANKYTNKNMKGEEMKGEEMKGEEMKGEDRQINIIGGLP